MTHSEKDPKGGLRAVLYYTVRVEYSIDYLDIPSTPERSQI